MGVDYYQCNDCHECLFDYWESCHSCWEKLGNVNGCVEE